MLPLILSFLGSGAAGAGLLGTGLLASPLVAGAVGTGLGTAIETGDLGKGIQAGLLGGLGGAALGSIMGGAAGAGAGAGAGGAAGAGTAATQAATQGTGMFGGLKNLPSGMASIPPSAAGTPVPDLFQQGIKQGAMTQAGLGAALSPGLLAPQLMMPDAEPRRRRPQAAPLRRDRRTPGAGYVPGKSGEALYFDPRVPGSQYAEGGLVHRMAGGGVVQLQAGGIADMPQGEASFPRAPETPRMNERELVSMAIKAVREEIPEEQAAIVLAVFVQQYGEDALRKLVDDVSEGRVQGGDMEGQIKGPGDGMDDLVPAQMDDGSTDVLLSDGEFIVPADVVSGLGNGSTDAGASELEDMMARVRRERTGMTEQPKQVAAGGLLPA